MSIYDFTAKTIRGTTCKLDEFRGKVMLIVNTASKCGFTPQYADLQKLYDKYQSQGFVILGFPCNQFGGQEPGTNEEVNIFCQLQYGVTFPMFEKIDVRGPNAHPLFQYLIQQAPFAGFDPDNASANMLHALFTEKMPELLAGDEIKWNFTKFLVDRTGRSIKRFEPWVDPLDMEQDIVALL